MTSQPKNQGKFAQPRNSSVNQIASLKFSQDIVIGDLFFTVSEESLKINPSQFSFQSNTSKELTRSQTIVKPSHTSLMLTRSCKYVQQTHGKEKLEEKTTKFFQSYKKVSIEMQIAKKKMEKKENLSPKQKKTQKIRQKWQKIKKEMVNPLTRQADASYFRQIQAVMRNKQEGKTQEQISAQIKQRLRENKFRENYHQKMLQRNKEQEAQLQKRHKKQEKASKDQILQHDNQIEIISALLDEEKDLSESSKSLKEYISN